MHEAAEAPSTHIYHGTQPCAPAHISRAVLHYACWIAASFVRTCRHVCRCPHQRTPIIRAVLCRLLPLCCRLHSLSFIG